MSREDDIAAVHKAATTKDYVGLRMLELTLDPEVFEAGAALILATLPLQTEAEDRNMAMLVYLAQHAPDLPIGKGIASLTADELLELHRIIFGDDE
ncbi:hypothetical protein [Aeromicrobium sp.]|uniref:hypothetical protein n=1 Tax=Aeromicrobium sp. TaxID=1871063 RepID=UPI0030C57035